MTYKYEDYVAEYYIIWKYDRLPNDIQIQRCLNNSHPLGDIPNLLSDLPNI